MLFQNFGFNQKYSTTTSSITDSISLQLTGTQLTTYNTASIGDWIKITQTQYNNVVANVTGATKKGNSDVQISTRDTLTAASNAWLAFGSSGAPSFQISSGEYVIAMIVEAWNQSGGIYQLGYTTAFTGSIITNIGPQARPSTGGGRDYFVRKAPVDSAVETRYPVLFSNVTPNAVSSWNGFRSSNSGSSWLVNPSNQTSKIQIVTTLTKSW